MFKNEQEHIRHFLQKNVQLRSFWKFHVVVVRNNGKEMYKKKVCCTCKVGFLLIRPIVVFSPFSLPSPLRITRFYILFGQTLNIIEGFVFSPGQIYILLYAFITIKLLFWGCKAPRTTTGCERYKSV